MLICKIFNVKLASIFWALTFEIIPLILWHNTLSKSIAREQTLLLLLKASQQKSFFFLIAIRVFDIDFHEILTGILQVTVILICVIERYRFYDMMKRIYFLTLIETIILIWDVFQNDNNENEMKWKLFQNQLLYIVLIFYFPWVLL